MPETKTCPDCAEEVLAEARKCRICGYRFDGGGAPPTLLADLLLGGRRRAGAVGPSELLAGWGVTLAGAAGDRPRGPAGPPRRGLIPAGLRASAPPRLRPSAML